MKEELILCTLDARNQNNSTNNDVNIFAYDYSEATNAKCAIVKNVFKNRHDMLIDVKKKQDAFEEAYERAYNGGGSLSGNDTVAKLGCRVQTSHEYRNEVIEYLSKEEDVNTSIVMLRLVESQLMHIIELSKLTESEKFVFNMLYFSKTQYSISTVAKYYSEKILRRSWKSTNKSQMQYIIDKTIRQKIVPVMTQMDYF